MRLIARLALDAVQRAHDAELKSITEKLRNVGDTAVGSAASTSSDNRCDMQTARQRFDLNTVAALVAQ